MAGFKTHISFSTAIGVGYVGFGYAVQDMPLDTAIVGGALCGFSGMLPDLDSDYGVPLRETMAFTAAIVPMLLVGHFHSLGLSHDGMILAAVSLYLLVRFGITNMMRKYTVHRGMFHSIPAALIFAGAALLLSGTSPIDVRYFKAGGVLLGFMSHLLLDEIYSVEWKGGRWQFKKSFGTAIKFWGGDTWANFSTYSKLAVVVVMVLGEPSVMERLQTRNPEFARRYQELQQRFHSVGQTVPDQSIESLSGAASDAFTAARAAAEEFAAQVPPAAQFAPQQYVPQPAPQHQQYEQPTPYHYTPQGHPAQGAPPTIERDIETAQRRWPQYPQ
jgi:membrane-bound metal-dependent hydrolase YbcI (DUF457 family)